MVQDFTQDEIIMNRRNIEIDFNNGVMPNLYGMNLMDAIFLLENAGLKVSFSGKGHIIDQSIKNDFQEYIFNEYPKSELVFAPIASARIKEVNGIDIATYIDQGNPSYWVIRSDRQISWLKKPAENNPIVEGEWWSDNPSDEMYISFDYDAAQDLGIKINDRITLSLYGRDITGVVKNFRDVDYADFTINFVMVLNLSLIHI